MRGIKQFYAYQESNNEAFGIFEALESLCTSKKSQAH